MVLLGRMFMVVASVAMVVGGPARGLAEPATDQAELAQEVLEAFDNDAQADFEHELSVRQQAEQGNAEAQHELGALLIVGKGTRQNYAEAAQWFQRAAEQGHSGAQYWLGRLYMRGVGVPRDMNRMLQWWQKAAVQGNINAQYALGTAYRDGRVVPQDFERARAWFFMASGKTGNIDPKAKRAVKARSALTDAEAVAAELRARRMERYKIQGPEGGR